MKYLSMCFLAIVTIGCSFFIPKPQKILNAKNTHYSINSKNLNWTVIKSDEYDYLFKKNNDIFFSQSFCHTYQDQKLDNLALKSFQGLEPYKIIYSKTIQWQGREAHEIYAHVSLDGVKVNFYLRNTRRNHCYFDFIFTSTRINSSIEDFQIILNNVEFK